MNKCDFQQNQAISKLPAVAEEVLKQVEERIRKAKDNQRR